MMREHRQSDSGSSNRSNPLGLLLHVPVPWVFVLTYFLGVCLEVIWPTRMPIISSRVRLGLTIAGVVLLATGVLVAAWCLRIFWKARTTTVPGRASVALVTWGPYRFSRNPMYVALSLAYLGEAGILKQAWPIACLPLTIAYVNWIVIPLEEARLGEVFGKKYAEYRARVRRWM